LTPVNPEPDIAADKPEAFRLANGAQISTASRLTKATLLSLSRSWPVSMSWSELLDQAIALLGTDCVPSAHEVEVLLADLLQGFTNGLVLLSRLPPPYANKPGDYPKASVLARHQAKTSGLVTSLRHEQVSLDSTAQRLLGWLDGQTSLESLNDRLYRHFPNMPKKGLTILLDGLAKAGLLLG